MSWQTYRVKQSVATQTMMKISQILLSYPYLALVPFMGVFLLFKYWGRIYSRPPVQKMFANLPTIGTIVRKSSAAVAFRTLAMLMESNVRISTALKITAESSPHVYHREFFTRVGEHIGDGLSLPEAFLMESHWLGKDGRNVSGLIEISSETGSSTDLLNEIADDYEEELDNIANQIDKIMEPITIILLGLMVGFLLYAIYSPIFGLGKVLLPGKGGKKKDYTKLSAPPAATAPAVPGQP